MNAILLGARSDIGLEMAQRLTADGWTVWGWNRDTRMDMLPPKWDLIICAIGTLKPVGRFFDLGWADWQDGFESNVLAPLRLVHALYPKREENASICFFGGTNPYKANPRYSAYASAKAALRMAVRDIGAEYPDLRVFMLDTGYVKTKIHVEPNDRTESTSHDQIYTVLQKCLTHPISRVSGFSFFVPNCAP